MRWQVAWTAEASLPSVAAVLESQGLPGEDRLPPRIGALLHDAMAVYRERAEPRAIVRLVERSDFAEVYRGDGSNDGDTPLERVFPRADALALFAATVGPRVTDTIRDLFGRQDPARGHMLDAVASVAADGLARAASIAVTERLQAAGDLPADTSVLAYSPGYCGWHVSGQRALFAALGPEEVGITLNQSCLMQPLKSVSGVIVAGPAEIHQFSPDFPCCERCTTRECQDRIASLGRG
jgi:hypothetical protein